DLGYGTGLYRTPPYYAVKVPVFSFEKLNDANSILGPEMKSTGEVLGIGRTLAEALFKGLTSAGFTVPPAYDRNSAGVLLSVETEDYQEIIPLARRLEELGLKLFATTGTAAAIASAGLPVTSVDNAAKSSAITDLMEQGEIKYIIYTGAVKDATMGDFIALHRRAMMLGIPCLTSLDTANALADMMASRFNLGNTELVDINDMRTQPQHISFTKMQDCGNDYIFIENFDGSITCPEALCVILCRPHYGIGADGIVLMERSQTADVKMRSFNRDGSEGKMAGNNLRCIGKYMYDKGYVTSRSMTVETAGGTKQLSLFIRDGKVSSVAVDIGKAELDPAKVPVDINKIPSMWRNIEPQPVLDQQVSIGGKEYGISCVSVGNPHCVVFVEDLEALDVASTGPKFEYSELFPDRVNAEFVRQLGPDSLRVKVWERGSGETLACGTGACAAVIAAAETGRVEKGRDIKVSLPGGDLTVNYTDERVILTGSAQTVYEGSFEY
ncbi:MAG: diaminopimelate epimerase, partial [Firmicutes bacterium]|nr:diaminopimelate epimerase [Bacillota bacterium]